MLYLFTEAVMVATTMPWLRVCTSPKMIKVRECVSMLWGAHAVFNEIRPIRAALHWKSRGGLMGSAPANVKQTAQNYKSNHCE